MSQSLDVLAEPIPVLRLDRLHDARVHGAPPLLRQTAVGHLVRQRVLERVFQLGEEIGLVQELRRLQPRQARGHGLLGQPGNVPQQRERDIVADDRRRLQQVPLLGRQPIDPRRQHRLHRRRDLQRRGVLRHVILPAPASQDPGLDQCPHALLQEEGVALGPLDQQARERGQARVIAEQDVQQLVGTGRRQRIESQLRVVALLPPAVLILAPVRDEQQQARAGQALDQAVQQRLGLGVDPVQVLDEQEQGAARGLPAAAAVSRASRVRWRRCAGSSALPRGVVHRHLEQGEQRRQRRLQRGVQGQQLARHLLADLAQRRPGPAA